MTVSAGLNRTIAAKISLPTTLSRMELKNDHPMCASTFCAALLFVNVRTSYYRGKAATTDMMGPDAKISGQAKLLSSPIY